MADRAMIVAEPRAARGKGGARAGRRAGRLPGVVYGRGEATVPVSVDAATLSLEYRRGGFFSRLYELTLAGEAMRVLPRDVQLDPVTDVPLHVDFLRLAADSRIDVDVAVHFVNDEECPGLRRGGVLNVVRHSVELNCRADAIPEFVTVDLTGLDIGDSVHISAVPLPEGVHPTIADRDFTVATIAAPTVVAEEEAAEAEGEEAEAAEGEEGEAEAGEAGESEGEGD